MRKWHDAERCRAAKRHAKVAAAPSTVGISKAAGGPAGRRGEGARGGREGGGGKGGRSAQETDVWVWASSS